MPSIAHDRSDDHRTTDPMQAVFLEDRQRRILAWAARTRANIEIVQQATPVTEKIVSLTPSAHPLGLPEPRLTLEEAEEEMVEIQPDCLFHFTNPSPVLCLEQAVSIYWYRFNFFPTHIGLCPERFNRYFAKTRDTRYHRLTERGTVIAIELHQVHDMHPYDVHCIHWQYHCLHRRVWVPKSRLNPYRSSR